MAIGSQRPSRKLLGPIKQSIKSKLSRPEGKEGKKNTEVP
jgi:hypothetical protein